MESTIKKLIELDHLCAGKVEAAKKKQYNLSTILKEKREVMYQTYLNEAKLSLSKKQASEEQLSSAKTKHAQEEYLKVEENLKKNFETHKEDWVNQIVERCLK